MDKSVYVILFLWTQVYCATVEIKCPEFCDCDIYLGLRRAVCDGRSLVSLELNMPSQVEVLDLTDNQISGIGENIFVDLGLTNLKALNLSSNKIRQIHLHGLSGLYKLKVLDFSYNAIQYFIKSWFADLKSLQELYLRGNKLRSINEEPLIDLKNLKVLDIGNCGITHLDATTFSLLPNLEVLDISQNFMQKLPAELPKTLPILNKIILHENSLICTDKSVKGFFRIAKSQNIEVDNLCLVGTLGPSQKFQKMVMAQDFSASSTVKGLTRNSWIIEEDDKIKNCTGVIEVCSNNCSNNTDPLDEGLLMAIIKLSPWITISIIFSYGVLFGMVLTCAIGLCFPQKQPSREPEFLEENIHLVRPTQSVPSLVSRSRRHLHRSNSVLYNTLQKARRQISRDNSQEDSFDDTLVIHEVDLATSTPVVVRKISPVNS